MPASPVPLYRRRWVRWLFVAFAAYSLAGFLVAPWLVRKQIVKQGGVALKRTVAVEQVRMNPWTLSLTLRGLAATDHDGSELAGFDELFVNFQASSLFRGEFHFAEIRLVHPRGRFVMNADGTHNLADLVAPSAAEKPATPEPSRPPPIGVAHLFVERGAFSYFDRSHSGEFETHFGPTSFELHDFTTRPKRSGAYTFAATTESGERFAWQGSLSFDPLASSGRIGVFEVKLPKYAPFHRDLVAVDVADGRLTVEADYEVSLAGEAVARMRNGTVTLQQLALRGRSASADAATAAPFLSIPLLKLEGIVADSAQRSASVAKLQIRDARIEATRRADGTIDVQQWLTPKVPAPGTGSASAASSGNPPAAPASWQATLGTIEVQNAALTLRDEALPRPAKLALDQIAFTASGASTALDRPITFQTTLRWNERGKLGVNGTLQPQPLAVDLAIDVTDFDLAPLDAYAASIANVAIRRGVVRAAGKLAAAQAPGGELTAHWEGDLGLADLAIEDGTKQELLAGVKEVAVKQLRFDLQPLTVAIAEVAITEPIARVAVATDGTNNLSAALGGKTAGPGVADGSSSPPANVPKTPAREAAATPRPNVKLDRLLIRGARFTLNDASVSPPFATELNEFGGSIAGLSSEKSARAVVDLAGKLGAAPLRVAGEINPLSADVFTDVKVTFTGIELPPFTPYSGKFVGYTIDRGKLSFDLRYRLSGREVVGENDVVLDQFFLGETVESPTAMKLPLKLALGIMRDADGRIVESLPVRGSLDDPDFRYGRIVMHAIRNLVVKTATAPFSVLGRIFGGGQDLSGIEFAGGSTELSAESVSRLDALGRALKERPALTLEIISKPQPRADEAALREAKLLTALRARKLRVEPPPPSATSTPGAAAAAPTAELVLTPEETDQMISGLFTETFPNYANAIATPAAGAAANAESAAPAERGSASGAPPLRVTRRTSGGNKGMRSVTVMVPASSGTPAPAPSPSDAAPTRASAPNPNGSSTEPPSLPSVAEMRAQLLPTLSVSSAEFADLAARRAAAVQQHLTANAQVDAARVTVAANETAPTANPAPPPNGNAVRVEFTLK